MNSVEDSWLNGSIKNRNSTEVLKYEVLKMICSIFKEEQISI